MKEKAILIEQDRIVPILHGKETRFQKIMRPQPLFISRDIPGVTAGLGDWDLPKVSPYGKKGDRLWVRETWSLDATKWMYPFPNVWYRADFDSFEDPALDIYPIHNKNCTGRHADCWACWTEENGRFRWKASVIMPREHARLFLEIIDVQSKRVQDTDRSRWTDHEWKANPWIWDVEFERIR